METVVGVIASRDFRDTRNGRARGRFSWRMVTATCAGLASLMLVGCEDTYESSPSTYEQGARSSGSNDAGRAGSAPDINRVPKRMPAHGRLIWLESRANTAILKNNIANGAFGRLTISVPNGGETYYVKLKELHPRRGPVLGAVIASGRTLTFDVPLDGDVTTYDLHYGAGTTWYGPAKAFGTAGTYAKAEETFRFERGTGWEVELIAQPGGNLGTAGLSLDEF